jgi:hypothetical protein
MVGMRRSWLTGLARLIAGRLPPGVTLAFLKCAGDVA